MLAGFRIVRQCIGMATPVFSVSCFYMFIDGNIKNLSSALNYMGNFLWYEFCFVFNRPLGLIWGLFLKK